MSLASAGRLALVLVLAAPAYAQPVTWRYHQSPVADRPVSFDVGPNSGHAGGSMGGVGVDVNAYRRADGSIATRATIDVPGGQSMRGIGTRGTHFGGVFGDGWGRAGGLSPFANMDTLSPFANMLASQALGSLFSGPSGQGAAAQAAAHAEAELANFRSLLQRAAETQERDLATIRELMAEQSKALARALDLGKGQLALAAAEDRAELLLDDRARQIVDVDGLVVVERRGPFGTTELVRIGGPPGASESLPRVDDSSWLKTQEDEIASKNALQGFDTGGPVLHGDVPPVAEVKVEAAPSKGLVALDILGSDGAISLSEGVVSTVDTVDTLWTVSGLYKPPAAEVTLLAVKAGGKLEHAALNGALEHVEEVSDRHEEMAAGMAELQKSLEEEKARLVAAGVTGDALRDRLVAFARKGGADLAQKTVQSTKDIVFESLGSREALWEVAKELPAEALDVGLTAHKFWSEAEHDVIENAVNRSFMVTLARNPAANEVWTSFVAKNPKKAGVLLRGTYELAKKETTELEWFGGEKK